MFQNKHKIHNEIYCRALAYYFKYEVSKYKKDLSKNFLSMINFGKKISLCQYKKLLKKQSIFLSQMDKILKKYDFIVSSSTYSCAPKLNCKEEQDMSLIWTLAHIPSVSVPILQKNNLPHGIQIVTRKYHDYKLFEFLKILNNLKIISDVHVVENY